GVQNYERTPDAEYADRDASFFVDYAHYKFGVPKRNIKTFINDKAGLINIKLALKQWLRGSVDPSQ
ncbi:MAG: hypothetical protein MKZ86_04330, partial [Alphaproteobacteria bacterium]|nr:hypothetical protein [Alphaproteobacteria bacterium]